MDIQHELQRIRHELFEIGVTITERQEFSQDGEALTTSIVRATNELDRVLEHLGIWAATTPVGGRITLRLSFQELKTLEYR